MECHGNTLLPQFLGMYRLTVDGDATYMIVTRNVFSHRLSVYKKYDLKVRGENKARLPTATIINWVLRVILLYLFFPRVPLWRERPATRRRYSHLSRVRVHHNTPYHTFKLSQSGSLNFYNILLLLLLLPV